MVKIQKANCLIVFVLCLLNVGNTSLSLPAQSSNLWGVRKSHLTLIYIIEFRDILCSPCSESFLDFCFSVPLEFQKENTWGIVVFDPDSQTNLGDMLIAKKVRGFMNGNQLHFPWVIDSFHVFKNLRTQTTQLFFLDSSSLTVKKYAFPLMEKHKNDIIQAVLASL